MERITDYITPVLTVVITIVITVLVILFVVAILLDFVVTRPYNVSGVVNDKVYQPSYYETSLVPDGKGGLKSVETYHPDDWSIIVEGEKYTVKAKLYYAVEVYDTVYLQCRKGQILGIISCYGATLVGVER